MRICQRFLQFSIFNRFKMNAINFTPQIKGKVARACNSPVERYKVFIGFTCALRVNPQPSFVTFMWKVANSFPMGLTFSGQTLPQGKYLIK